MLERRRVTRLLVLLLMASLVLAACSSGGGNTSSSDTGNTPSNAGNTAPSNADAANGTGDSEETVYPIQTDTVLSYWAKLPGGANGIKTSHNEIPFFQEWQERTGVKLDYITVPFNQEQELLNIMLASGQYPDLIEYSFAGQFPGGPEKAIRDGFIIELNDLIDAHAPNLKKFLAENPEIDKMVKTDNGVYYAFPFIRGDEFLNIFQGPIIRKDWLDQLGLPVPETIDEWYTTLKAFKDELGVSSPASFQSSGRPFSHFANGAFVGAFGTKIEFFLNNEGKVVYGPMEPGYKDFLATFASWFSEGLLDRNIATADSKAIDSLFATGQMGATVGNAGGGIGKWQQMIEADDPNVQLIGAPYPVLNKGDTPMFGQRDFAFGTNGMVAISSQAKDPVLAVKMLDYAYGEEGHLFFNFGIEGVSYEMIDGYPTYTDLIMNNPDGLAPSQAMTLYIRGNYNGPFVQDKRYAEQFFELDSQKEAIETWGRTNAEMHNLPPISPTPEESSEFARIMNDVNTLVDEMTLKIILGTEPVDNYEMYVDRMRSLNIERAIEIQEAALARYNAR